jgi:hypothetical protein
VFVGKDHIQGNYAKQHGETLSAPSDGGGHVFKFEGAPLMPGVRRAWHFRVQEVIVILLRVMAVSFLACMMLASAEVHAQDRADQLRAIERARLRSLVDADLATARRLHADDFELINPRGGTLSKEQYLKDIASGDLDYLEWEPEEIRVRLYGKSAVIRYKAHLRVSVKGSAGTPVTFWHTDLYEKRNGQWHMVWGHATQIPQR